MSDYRLIALILAVSPPVTYFATLAVERASRIRGILAEDVHKGEGRKLPKIGGLGFLLGLTVSLLLIALDETFRKESMIALMVAWTAGLIGLVDDLIRLGGKTKVILTMIPGILLMLLQWYKPYLYIPFIGMIRATIIYPLLLPVIFAVSSNALNMVDTFTGIAPTVTLVLTLYSIAAMLIEKTVINASILVALAIASTLIGYIPRNYYPGKTFNGDTGTLAWGALLAFIGITGKIEVFLALSAMPIVTNGFTILASIKGIVEHTEIKERPTIVDRNRNMIRANPSREAPITLTHLLTLRSEMKEDEIVLSTILLVVLTSILTLIAQRIIPP